MILKIILGVVFGAIFLLNLLAPLLIKKVQKLPARIKLTEHDESNFLSNRDEQFNDLDSKIRALGFEYQRSSFLEDSHTQTNFSLYSNEEDLSCAMVVSMESAEKSMTYVEYSQIYSDGSMLDVTNADQVPAYPDMDLKIAASYPHVKEPEALYDIFNTLKATLKRPASPIKYDNTTGFKMVEDFMAKESDILVGMGYCEEEMDEEDKRALTYKGAFLITWKNIFPGNKIMTWFYSSRSKKMLAKAQ